MYYYSDGKISSEMEVRQLISEEFRKTFGFRPDEQMETAILKKDTLFYKLPKDADEALSNIHDSDVIGAEVMLGYMQATAEKWFETAEDAETQQNICDTTKWSVIFSCEDKTTVFDLTWGPSELDVMENLLKDIIDRDGEITAK